ncbi:MAG: 2,3,4,5-tetrahydropyridine-2,6-dicarboxylate N-succinyltransferase, partial [Pseudomonadota bacterium]
MTDALARVIDQAWEGRADISTGTQGEVREAVDAAIDLLDTGEARVAQRGSANGDWTVNQWLKKAVLLSFRLNANTLMDGGPGADGKWWDKVPSKFDGWDDDAFQAAGFRDVPPATVRRGSF